MWKLNEEEKLKYLQEGLQGIKEIQLLWQRRSFHKNSRIKSEKIAKNFYSYYFLLKAPGLVFEFLFCSNNSYFNNLLLLIILRFNQVNLYQCWHYFL